MRLFNSQKDSTPINSPLHVSLQPPVRVLMRFHRPFLLPLLLLIVLLSALPTHAVAPSASLLASFCLSNARTLLITAARTQAISAVFTGIDELKTCLNREPDEPWATCVVGPVRTFTGAYLLQKDLNRWFFGTGKRAAGNVVKRAANVVGKAVAAAWVLRGKWEKNVETWGNTEWGLWLRGKGERPQRLREWGSVAEKVGSDGVVLMGRLYGSLGSWMGVGKEKPWLLSRRSCRKKSKNAFWFWKPKRKCATSGTLFQKMLNSFQKICLRMMNVEN